jgi:putative DNA primase/helicase
MIVDDELGIGHDPGQHAAYVGSWIKALQDDPLEIFRAAADAEKAQDFVLAFEQKQVQQIDQEQEAAMSIPENNNTPARPVITPSDAQLAEALRLVRTADSFPSRRFQEGVLDATADDTLGFRVPSDWTGQVQIKGAVERDGAVQWAEVAGVEAEFYGTYARKEDNTFQWLADLPTEQQAHELPTAWP